MSRNLAYFRKKIALSQDLFAVLIGTSRSLLAQAEIGRRSLSSASRAVYHSLQSAWDEFSSRYPTADQPPLPLREKVLKKRRDRLILLALYMQRDERLLALLPKLPALYQARAFWMDFQAEGKARDWVKDAAQFQLEEKILDVEERKAFLEMNLDLYRLEGEHLSRHLGEPISDWRQTALAWAEGVLSKSHEGSAGN